MRASKGKIIAAASAAMLVAAIVSLVAPAAVSAAASSRTPAWAGNPRLDEAGDLVVRLAGGGMPASRPGNQGSPCPAESSSTGNVQVNCLAEDGTSPQNTESETSVAAVGNKVVVGFNDSLVCCVPALNFTGYSVSTDGGKSFTNEGDLPWKPTSSRSGTPRWRRTLQGTPTSRASPWVRTASGRIR